MQIPKFFVQTNSEKEKKINTARRFFWSTTGSIFKDERFYDQDLHDVIKP